MDKKKIDLSEIKEQDLDKTSSFTDIMTRKERKNRHDDIEEMVKERKKSTSDLTKDVVEAKKIYDEEKKVENKEESLGKTQI